MKRHTPLEYRFLKITDFLSHLTWTNIVHIFCSILAIVLAVAFVIKMFRPDLLVGYPPEYILVALAVVIFAPYITHFEGLGVKVDIRDQVQELSSWMKATPYYTLASEFQDEKDYFLAELYYLKSLNESSDFWPSLLGLASIYDDLADEKDDLEYYNKAIYYYQKVLVLDKENIYALNNLAADYLSPPKGISPDPDKALENADKALDIIRSFGSALFFKGEALNLQKKYKDASECLNTIINEGLIAHDKDLYWAYYELAVVNSNTGKRVTSGDLQNCYELAKNINEDEEKSFIKILASDKEQKRFIEKDQQIIKKFLKEYSSTIKRRWLR